MFKKAKYGYFIKHAINELLYLKKNAMNLFELRMLFSISTFVVKGKNICQKSTFSNKTFKNS